jgi:hypothetical protein
MKEARLVVDPSSIALRTSGTATGDIALAIAGVVFPVAGWNDFVVVILEAWLSALVRMVQNASDAERVHFMEGPYAVDMTRLNTGAIQVRAFERPNRPRAIVDVMPLALVQNAVSSADDVLKFCRNQGHRSADLDRLEAATATLRKEVPNLTN